MRYATAVTLLALLLGVAPVATTSEVDSSKLAIAALGDPDSDLIFTPVEPCRIVDTRQALGGPMVANTIRPFFVAGTAGFPLQGGRDGGCNIPEGATAVAINIVAVTPSAAGWLKAFAYDEPTPEPPLASTVNFGPVAGLNAIANGTVVPICNPASMTCTYDLLVQVSLQANLHMVVDVAGYFHAFPGDEVQHRVTGTCAPGSSIRAVNQNGTVTCEPDDNTNAATMCASGYYLDGSGSCVSTSTFQSRVTGYCSTGSSIRVVNSNGSVTCEPDTDTNAGTLCPDGYFLNGDGTCDPLSDVTETIGGLIYYSVGHNGGTGTTRTTSMGSTTNRFCALAYVHLRDTDSAGETAGCRVYISSSTWYLEAYLADPSDDADAWCGAYCFTLQ